MKKIVFTLISFILIYQVQSQVTVNLNGTTHNTVQTGCSFWFYDDGGSGGVYSSGQDQWITFHSNNVTNTHIKLDFAAFDIESGDTLYFYDGPTIASPLISKHNNSYNPLISPNTVIQASLSNASGDITVRFKTNGSGNNTGWNAAVYCSPMCQAIHPGVDTLVMNPLPDDSNYVDICFGEPVVFAASGGNDVFVENDILYHQDAASSLFIWDFGDGLIDTGQVITHTYTAVNGYNVYLHIVDVNGCISTQQLYLRVRIAGNPIVTVNPPSTLCVGDVLNFLAGTAGNSTVVLSTGLSTVSTQMYDSLTFIPDGPNCPQQCYGTPVVFNNFPPLATIQNATDIESICMNIEHSFAGDLSFRIICPNGQSAVLDSYDNSGGSYLGQAEDLNDGSPVCSPSANPPGVGWTYCWSEMYPQQGTLNTLDAGTSPIPATDTINHLNYITPENPLTSLVGCPLNGTWSIEICDNWGIDNGYVFYWTLTLQNQAQTAGWTYEVGIDHVDWTGHSLTINTDSTATILADSIGTFPYNVTVYDDFGCTNTSTFNVQVVGVTGPILGPDVTICSGASTTITAQGGQFYTWSNGGNTASITVSPLTTTLYTVSVMSANGCTATDNITVNVIQTPVANAGADNAVCTLSYNLQAVPSAGTGTWTGTGPGTINFNNANSPTALVTVSVSGVYTFTWTEDNGNGCVSNDNVVITFTQMPVADAGPDISVCQLNSALAAIPSVGTGIWTQTSGPGTLTISVPASATSAVSSAVQGTYSLTWTEDNGNGCISSDNMILTLTLMPTADAGIRDSICSLTYSLQATPSVGTGLWSQISGPGFSNFSVQNSPVSNVTTSAYGDYQLLWTENNGNGCIDSDTVLITFNYIPTADYTYSYPPCFGDNITVTFTGLSDSYAQYNWIFTNASIPSGNTIGPYVLNYSQPGNNTISLTVSQHGCVSATNTQPVVSPPLLTLALTKTDVTCFGFANGTVYTIVNGGTPPISYNWNTGSVFTSIGSASPGLYAVTITDYNGCIDTASVIIMEPSKLANDVPDYIPICNDSTLTIISSATGGIFPYSYMWNTGSTNISITVSPDTTTHYLVVTTDANGCTKVSDIEVFVYPPIGLTSAVNTDSICPGEQIIFTGEASGGNGNYSYYLNGTLTNIPATVYPNATQSYTVSVSDGCNYTGHVDIPVHVYPSPPNNPSSDLTSGCLPLAIQFNEQSADSTLNYYWNFGDGEAAYVKNPLHIFKNPGTYDISLTTTNIYGCQVYNLIPDWITAFPVPHAQFEADPPKASIIKPVISFINYSSLTDSVQWFFGDGDSSSKYEPVHVFPTYPPGIYDISLITFTSQGCTDTIYGTIEIKDEFTFYAPTAFSPDNDGKNEMFFVYGNGIDENTFQISVYDRWGEIIWESSDMKKGWDGRVKGGELAPVGTFSWLAVFRDFNGIAHERTGAVTIIR